MIEPKILVNVFERNYRIIRQNAEGLTHEDSLLQMPSGGNCFNWIIGHIVSARSGVMRALGIEPVWTDEQRAIYRGGSAPITAENAHTAYRLEDILRDLDRSQEAIIAALYRKTLADMNAPTDIADRSLGESINYFGWHEGYHIGQLEYPRNLAGKHEKVL